MRSIRVYELRGDPDKFPGFLQAGLREPSDENSWKEHIGIRCGCRGSEPFGGGFVPVILELDAGGRHGRDTVGDVCLSMQPFIVFSSKARQVLERYLTAAGEFLRVSAPLPGFIGYRVLKPMVGVIDIESSVYTRYENGRVFVRKPVMYEEKVIGCDIFTVEESPGEIYVSQDFRQSVEDAKLRGFDFSREVPLTVLRATPPL